MLYYRHVKIEGIFDQIPMARSNSCYDHDDGSDATIFGLDTSNATLGGNKKRLS